jgi:rubrerythrin
MIKLRRASVQGLLDAMPNPLAVQQALQSAIELEHSTIPLYLYALYSLDATKNAEIAAILQSVVIEEMLHMTLSANVLNALGGSPVLDRASFIPAYPGPLPGGVEAQLTVHLAPFSMAQLQTFLTIEEPEDPIEFKALTAAVPEEITIGEFYARISRAIGQLGDKAFSATPRNQVGPELMDEAVVVTNVASAQQALTTIVEQGEGTKDSPKEVAGGGYAHYYRFMQIQKGHLLVPRPGGTTPDTRYAYTGEAVPFNASGVYAVPTDPSSRSYTPNSIQAAANNNFNYTYTSLLRALHGLFNGQATQAQMNVAIGLMMSLKGQAKAMTAGIPDPAVLTGPSFEYLPVNPGSGTRAG